MGAISAKKDQGIDHIIILWSHFTWVPEYSFEIYTIHKELYIYNINTFLIMYLKSAEYTNIFQEYNL